jgi:hypothetical protein
MRGMMRIKKNERVCSYYGSPDLLANLVPMITLIPTIATSPHKNRQDY